MKKQIDFPRLKRLLEEAFEEIVLGSRDHAEHLIKSALDELGD